jgi:hypothetical protein
MPDPSEAPASIPNSALMLGNWVAFQEQDGGRSHPPFRPSSGSESNQSMMRIALRNSGSSARRVLHNGKRDAIFNHVP